MGGRGAGSGGGLPTGGGGGGGDVISTTNLSSERETYRSEVDQVLTVARDIQRDYGVIANDLQVAVMTPGSTAMAYYDSSGNVAINRTYFNDAKIQQAYDNSIQSGFHPGNGSKTAMEAVAAHEMGHLLTAQAAERVGDRAWDVKTAKTIVNRAVKSAGVKDAKTLANRISGYAKTNYAECIAEAFSDVYCNGRNARRESTAVVNELNRYFGR
jgi:hypothetical protein